MHGCVRRRRPIIAIGPRPDAGDVDLIEGGASAPTTQWVRSYSYSPPCPALRLRPAHGHRRRKVGSPPAQRRGRRVRQRARVRRRDQTANRSARGAPSARGGRRARAHRRRVETRRRRHRTTPPAHRLEGPSPGLKGSWAPGSSRFGACVPGDHRGCSRTAARRAVMSWHRAALLLGSSQLIDEFHETASETSTVGAWDATTGAEVTGVTRCALDVRAGIRVDAARRVRPSA
jgi:hypothetical protein